MEITSKINKRLEVIRFSINMLNSEMRKSDFAQPHLLRQKDKLNIEKRILKKVLQWK